jgi:predicted ArsR family transcriptional regulator
VIDLQQEARVLGEPTRHAIFRYLAEHGPGVDIATLTEHIGLHHNAVRQHLARLVEAGLVLESVAPPTGRGRPRLVYEVQQAAAGRWDVVGPYERLAVLQAEMARTGDAAVEVGRRAGRDEARRALSTGRPTGRTTGGPPDPVNALRDHFERSGFAPMLRRRGAQVDLVLTSCPFAAAARVDPGSVCALHLGIAEGFAAALGAIGVLGLDVADPSRGRCRLRCAVSTS